MGSKKPVRLIYFLLDRFEEGHRELNLKELSDLLLKFNNGLELIKRDFPQLKISQSLHDDYYFGTNPAQDMETTLQYHVTFSGNEELLKKAGSSFMDSCGIPYGVGGNSKILKDYFKKNGKRIKGKFLNHLNPHNRKPIADNN